MGLLDMFSDHGNYEITYKASKVPVWNFDKVPEGQCIIEADSKYDAEKKGEKFLKKQGYYSVHIIRAELLKRTPKPEKPKQTYSNYSTNSDNSSSYSTSSNSSSSSSKSDKGSVIFGAIMMGAIVALIAIFAVVFFRAGCSESELNGKYYFNDSYGTATSIVVDNSETYLEMEDGECVLHLTLINPAGSSTHYFSYTGDNVEDIRFNKDYIQMNRMGWIIIRLNFQDSTYINLEFIKE